MKTILAILALTAASFGQANFAASADNRTGSTVAQHLADTRISTSTDSGFTSAAAVIFEHIGGKDFNVSPDNGVMLFGSFQFGTGSLLSGDVSTTAVFGSDSSYVTISSNGACGAWTNSGNCKVGFTTPLTDTLFVGIFLGNITWVTNLDGTHTVQGVVRGHVNGATSTVDLNFTAQIAPHFQNGYAGLLNVSVAPF